MTRPVEPSLEALMAWLRDGAVQPDPRLPEDLRSRHDERAARWGRVFGTEDGRKVLEDLANATIRRPSVDHRLSGQDYLAYAQLRCGQDQVFALVLSYLQDADELTRTPHEHRNRRPEPEPGSVAFPGGRPEPEPLPGGRPEPGAGGGPEPGAGGVFDPTGEVGVT